MYTNAIYTYRTLVYLYIYIYIFMPICAYIYMIHILYIYPYISTLESTLIHPSTWLQLVLFFRLIYDATWADPQFDEGLGPNERGGEAISFGPVPWCLEPVGGSEVKAGGWLVCRFWKNKKDLVFLTKNGWKFWMELWGIFFSKQNMFWLPPQKSNKNTKIGHI